VSERPAVSPSTTYEFRARLEGLVKGALGRVPHVVPIEGDPVLDQLQRALTAAETLILDTVHPPEQRELEAQEDERERRLRIRGAALETLLMRLDRHAQRIADDSVRRPPAVLVRLDLELFVQAVIDLVERLPDGVLDELTSTSSKRHETDPRLPAILAVFRSYPLPAEASAT
jgi:hypothetical protein